jgi:hypothetical protein
MNGEARAAYNNFKFKIVILKFGTHRSHGSEAENYHARYWLTAFSSCGAMNISLNKSKAPTTMALSAMLKAGQ